jgi:iron(III) transport system substrate-binding protein
VANTYYMARLMRSAKPNEKAAADKLAVVLPNAANRGTHVNISGGGMLRYAPNKDSAVKFLEYLASDEAQRYFADGNNEWPVVAGVKLANPALESFGPLKVDSLNLVKVGQNQPVAQRIADRSGFK